MIINADILDWAASYDGLLFHALLQNDPADVIFPENHQPVAVLCSAIGLALIIHDIAMLDCRKAGGLIEARISVPECAVYFNQRIDRWNVKVVAISAQSVLLLISDAHAIEDGSEFLLKSVVCFTRATSSDLIGGQIRMALARFFGRELAPVGLANLLFSLWSMCTTIHPIFCAGVRFTMLHVDFCSPKDLHDQTRSTIKQIRDLPTIHAILVHLHNPWFERVSHLRGFFTSTLTRAKLTAPRFLMAIERRCHKGLAAIDACRRCIVTWHIPLSYQQFRITRYSIEQVEIQ